MNKQTTLLSLVKTTLLFILAAPLFLGCNSANKRNQLGKGNIPYGDTLCFFNNSPIGKLFPLYSTDIYSHRVSSQLFETLLILDPQSSEVVGNLAKKVVTSADNKKIKLFLREDVFFHEDPCFGGNSNKMTAQDVKFSLDFACSSNQLNNSGKVLSEKIIGGEENYSSKKIHLGSGVSGIKIINDYCLEINLKEPYVNFQKLLTSTAYGIFSKNAYKYYKKEIVNHPIGTGPFILGKKTNNNILLRYNPNYWKIDAYGNKLPYLNAIIIRNGKTKKEEFALFRQKQTDIVFEVPSESLNYLLGSVQDAQKGGNIMHRVLVSPGASISSIAFNLNMGPFKKITIRKAIDLVINRNQLCNNSLNGDGAPANRGFTPPSKYYKNEQVSERKYDIAEAKRLLAISGYNEKTPLSIKLFIGGGEESKAYKWCKYICDELRNQLGIKVQIILGSFTERENAIANNTVDAWNVGWAADYPDPEGYFSLFYVKNKTSTSSSKSLFPILSSLEYNQYYYQATLEKDRVKRNNLFNKCDSIIKSEAVILPILIDDFVAIINLRVRNFKLSPLGLVDFTSIYLKELS